MTPRRLACQIHTNTLDINFNFTLKILVFPIVVSGSSELIKGTVVNWGDDTL